MEEARSILWFREFPGTLGVSEWYDWDRHPESARWTIFREALTKDADASPPAGAP